MKTWMKVVLFCGTSTILGVTLGLTLGTDLDKGMAWLRRYPYIYWPWIVFGYCTLAWAIFYGVRKIIRKRRTH